jgi:2'-5' RNA ligase
VKSGVFVTVEITGPAREKVLAVQSWADPRLANGTPPHVTIAGSSGAGPMPADTKAARIRELVEPIALDTAPITVQLERPHRFMQTDIIVLPIDPHGALRTLHERLRNCGLQFEQPRFPFSPHVTLSFYPRLTAAVERRLMAVRVDDPVVLTKIAFYLTLDPQPAKLILELPLGGGIRESGVGSR